MRGLISRLSHGFGSRDDDAREDLRLASRIPGVSCIDTVPSRSTVRVAGV
ncbi:DNA-binding protein, partial [Burkholderia multivorans]